VFGRTWHLPHWGSDHEHPLRRQIGLTILVALLLATIALLLLPPHARGNFVYWTNPGQGTIGRAKINGTGANNAFIAGLGDPQAVAVDSKFIYWTQGAAGGETIGRANLDGSGANSNFIPSGLLNTRGIAITPSGIYWSGDVSMSASAIGRANLNGSGPVPDFIAIPENSCGLAADSNFVYFTNAGANKLGRATLDGTGVDPGFISVPDVFCGVAVDPSFIYWGSDTGNTVGRAPVGGGTADAGFIAAGTSGGGPSGVAVNSQYVFWGNYDTGAIGRANINGGSPNPALIPGAGIAGPPGGDPSQLAAAPSNKITINSITRKKKKGTATINAKVPGPGQVTLNQVSTPPDVNATAASVKQVGLTIAAASSFKLPVKPKGKTAKKLKKQVRKKGKGKVKVKVFIHFVPAGVAGVPNTEPLTVKLVKKGKKKT
jgi:low-density lipoprotein receptor class B